MRNIAWGTTYITGGSSGIGFAIAQLVLKQGGSVVLLSRSVDRLEEAQEKLLTQYDADAVSIMELDVSQHDAVAGVIQRAVDRFGAPDTVVNCAGMAYPDHFFRLPLSVFEQTVGTNLLGTIAVSKALLPYLKAGSRIINVSSIAGFIGTYGYTAYSASKFGIIGFSQALRNELKPEGIQVSVLCPPDTDTPQLVKENETKPPETRAISGNAKLMSAEQVALAFARGVSRGRFMIIPGLSGRLIYLLDRLFPGMVRSIMDSIVRKARRQEGITRRL